MTTRARAVAGVDKVGRRGERGGKGLGHFVCELANPKNSSLQVLVAGFLLLGEVVLLALIIARVPCT